MLRLRDPSGVPVPLQARATARWDDGSVKWALLDFLARAAPSETTTYSLEVGTSEAPTWPASPASPASPGSTGVTVRDADQRLVVDTGALRAVFSRRSFGVLSQVSVHGMPVWESPSELSIDLEHLPPGPPDEENWLRTSAGGPRERFEARACEQRMVVEEAGPVRATIRVSGCHANAAGARFAPYDVWVHLYAGQAFARLQHTFVFDGEPKRDFLRWMALRFGPIAGADAFTIGLPAGRSVTTTAGPLGLVEPGAAKHYHLVAYGEARDAAFRIEAPGGPLAIGEASPGWADVSSKAVGVTVALRDFAHQYPKAIRLEANGGLSVDLWPEADDEVLDLRRRSDVVDDEYHYDLTLSPRGGRGIAKSHELLLDFHRGPVDPARAAGFSRALDEPLWAFASPEYNAETAAFGAFHPRDPQRFPRLERSLDFALAWLRANQRAFHWDGLVDYGDTLFHGYEIPTHRGDVRERAWGSRGYVGWLNNDGDLVHSLYLQYLRSGDRRVMHTAEAMARHVMDVDTCHYDPDDPGNVGGGHRHDEQHWGNHIVGYGTASQGTIDDYLLTGDARALVVARENASFHLAPTGEDEGRYGALLRFAELTRDEGARAAAARVLDEQLGVPTGAAWPFVTPRHFRFVSLESTGLLLAESVRHDARLGAAIVSAVDGVADELTSDWRDPGYAPQILIAEAHRQTRATKYGELAKAVVHALRIPAAGAAPASFEELPFEELVRIGRLLRVNNLMTANLELLCGLPYLMRVLADEKISEADVDAYVPRHDLPAPFVEELDPARLVKESPRGFAYVYDLAHGSPSDARGGPSTLELYEDGRLLGPAHAAHADIRALGRGRWSHWGSNTIRFSASDDSDPRTNRRRYFVRQR